MGDPSLDRRCIDTIRTLAIDAVQQANSGHPGLPMGAAPMAHVLWHRHLRHDPSAPDWTDRDRFVLSAGHGSMLLYGLLHLSGYDLSLEEIQNFRQWKSRTPGHPEFGHTPGVETTTGPLGQGASNAVGMALAERVLAHNFNRPGHTIVDHRTYALVSDGDLMEGVASEAASLAGQWGLHKLTYLYDDNGITIDGDTGISFSRENVARRFEAYGWQTLVVENADEDFDSIHAALEEARRDDSRPSLILLKTTIGYGSPAKQGTPGVHGAPLGADEIARTKEALGWDPDAHFHVPTDVRDEYARGTERGREIHRDWKTRFARYSADHPDLARRWKDVWSGDLPLGWDRDLPRFEPGESLATRVAFRKALNSVAPVLPHLIGGAADLAGSVGTVLDGEDAIDGRTGAGRNLHFGIREHAMGAIANGLCYHGGIRPFTGTFLVFSDYMKPAVRLAAMNRLPVTFVWSHDSIGLGEDGPTHQPIEHLAALRSIPGLAVFRPADANETAAAWRWAMETTDMPTAIITSRQKLPVLQEVAAAPDESVARGAYVLRGAPAGRDPDIILIGTGSEVHVCLEAATALEAEGISAHVVSMPSWDRFEAQDQEYQDQVLPPTVLARVSIEAASSFGWSRWVGMRGESIGIDRYGASAPGQELLDRFGFEPTHVAEVARRIMNERTVPSA